MVRCQHESCGREERIWLPTYEWASNDTRNTGNSGRSDAALHHWCKLCGCIQNISDDRPRKMGYWINILSKIAKGQLLTQIQKRLVVKELESYEYFDDLYGITSSAQKEVFVKAIKKYCSLHESIIDSYIC